MILQVLADARQVEHRRDADRLEFGSGTDPRGHQYPGRVDGTGRKHDLAAGRERLLLALMPNAQSRGATLGDDQIDHLALAEQCQILAMKHRTHKGAEAAEALPAILRDVVDAKAKLAFGVEVGVGGEVGVLASLDEHA